MTIFNNFLLNKSMNFKEFIDKNIVYDVNNVNNVNDVNDVNLNRDKSNHDELMKQKIISTDQNKISNDFFKDSNIPSADELVEDHIPKLLNGRVDSKSKYDSDSD
jgi:hypothetical protein